MENDPQSNVLRLHRAPPLRATIARLAANYPAQLALVTRDARLADGTLSDEGRPMCRAMTAREKRKCAVHIASSLFLSLFYHRARMEHAGNSPAVHLVGFYNAGFNRISGLFATEFGRESTTVVETTDTPALHAFHEALVQAVFGAFRFEMGVEQPDEPGFWQRVFLGLADVPDPSGVLREAAHMVFLDYRAEFAAALAADLREMTDSGGTRH